MGYIYIYTVTAGGLWRVKPTHTPSVCELGLRLCPNEWPWVTLNPLKLTDHFSSASPFFKCSWAVIGLKKRPAICCTHSEWCVPKSINPLPQISARFSILNAPTARHKRCGPNVRYPITKAGLVSKNKAQATQSTAKFDFPTSASTSRCSSCDVY